MRPTSGGGGARTYVAAILAQATDLVATGRAHDQARTGLIAARRGVLVIGDLNQPRTTAPEKSDLSFCPAGTPAHAHPDGRTDTLAALARATVHGIGGAILTARTLALGQITIGPPAGRAKGGRAVGRAACRSSVHTTCSGEATRPSGGHSPDACPSRAWVWG